MMVRAIGTVTGGHGGTMRPGDIFTVSDDEVQRLLDLGAVEPVRKMIKVQIDVSGADDKSAIDNVSGE